MLPYGLLVGVALWTVLAFVFLTGVFWKVLPGLPTDFNSAAEGTKEK